MSELPRQRPAPRAEDLGDGSLGDLRLGSLEVRLATRPEEIDAAQALRYRVFYEERRAVPTDEMRRRARDFDAFDDHADHLLVLDHARGPGAAAVIGTYRLLRREAAARVGRFYTADEFDVSMITGHPGGIMELGRSCVDPDYRTRPTMQLMWRGIAAYVFQFDVELMFGCASLQGTEIGQLAVPLSYLHHFHLAQAPLRPRALPERYVSMDLMPKDRIDQRAALAALPPLIKGYLRLGGTVGDGAVVDHQFNTTDVCVLVDRERVAGKYYKHYERSTREAWTQ